MPLFGVSELSKKRILATMQLNIHHWFRYSQNPEFVSNPQLSGISSHSWIQSSWILHRFMRHFAAMLVVTCLLAAPGLTQENTATPAGKPHETIQPPLKAQEFKFSNPDLELLRQVNAFDRYIEEKAWVFHDPTTEDYLKEVGMQFIPPATPEYVNWHFRVLRDPDVNAFALPNGSVYVNSGLLARMENEAQLAGVLAHEITHVTNRHTFFEYRDQRAKFVAIDIVQAGAGAVGAAGPIASVIAAAMGNVVPLAVVYSIYGYSRDLEHESDSYAVNILNADHYDLKEFARGFELLRKGPEVDLSKEPFFWASHPKLESRVQYVSAMAAQLQPNEINLRTESARYIAGTKNAVEHDAALAMMLGRPRTAVAVAQRLISLEPNDASHYVLLGDAYRSLGARTPVPTEEELSDKGKNEARKRLKKMTLVEYDKALKAAPGGRERWEQNCLRSEEAFHKALEMDPANAEAHRGLGFLYEDQDRRAAAVQEYKKYLELAPDAQDARRVRLRLQALEHHSGVGPS